MNTLPTLDDFAQVEESHRANRARQLAMAIPPATEPLDSDLLGLLRQSVHRTLTGLGGGQLPELPLSSPDASTTEVPPELGAALVGLQQAVTALEASAPAAGRYKFDVGSATSNDGLKNLIALVDTMGRDRELTSQLQGQQSPTLPPTV